ncbi:hypothetical protein ElyMa_000942100 [Elysia marginata]|uniref:Uncharacterized protein n=1 Tax=Elysia marginata TaxID=1093978 RepID=A0AAV4HF38_9GAST|nr:hypothetical protein ElyMa_000942100 [Elysia marginata]
MANSGQAPEGNLATAATAPVDCTTNRSSQIRYSTTTTTHALTPVREARSPRHADFLSAEDADMVAGATNSTLELCRLKNLANIFNEDIEISDRIANSAMC